MRGQKATLDGENGFRGIFRLTFVLRVHASTTVRAFTGTLWLSAAECHGCLAAAWMVGCDAWLRVDLGLAVVGSGFGLVFCLYAGMIIHVKLGLSLGWLLFSMPGWLCYGSQINGCRHMGLRVVWCCLVCIRNAFIFSPDQAQVWMLIGSAIMLNGSALMTKGIAIYMLCQLFWSSVLSGALASF
ncbi:hypothetical protein U1Q18_036739 [Sarracenia purpurea var. burkii]